MSKLFLSKKLAMLLVIMALMASSVSVFAAQQPEFVPGQSMFTDVPAKHWAYSAVSQLTKAGIVDGYSDGAFRGDRTISRYEMAIIAGKAMTKLDKADAQNKALIEKLANEFGTELDKLGARVAKLEANQPTILWNGQVRGTYSFRSDKDQGTTTNQMYGLDTNRSNYFTYRVRLQPTVIANDRLIFTGRLTTQDLDMMTGSAKSSSPSMEIAALIYKKPFGYKNATIYAGRLDNIWGKAGIENGTADAFIVDYYKPDFGITVGYRSTPLNYNLGTSTNTNYAQLAQLYAQVRFKPSSTSNVQIFNDRGIKDWNAVSAASLFSAWPVYPNPNWLTKRDLWAVALDQKVGNKLSFYGEYGINRAMSGTPNKIYWFGLTNGNPAYHPAMGVSVNWQKPGDNAQALIYRHFDYNAVGYLDSTLNVLLGNGYAGGTAYGGRAIGGGLWMVDTKGYEFYDTRVLSKNVVLMTQIGVADSTITGKRMTTYGIAQLYIAF